MSAARRHNQLELAAAWRLRAAELDAYAGERRRLGDVYGPESAEDAEQAAADYRAAADGLEREAEEGSS